ncbi:MAG: hypothetical protein PWQ37_2081 [Candidatus Petromonas sp.]|jgi:uncharacterized protein YoxC|nr:hypothetical protein [Candidatus Petromonas sp.]
MNVTISLADLGLILLWVALLVLIIYIILVLKNFNDTLKEVKEVVSSNKENIKKTLEEIPSIAKNIDDITGEVSHDVKAVRGTIDNITEKSEVASASLSETGDLITSIAAAIQAGLFMKNLIQSIFSKSKRVA